MRRKRSWSILASVKQNATFDSSFWIDAHRAGLLTALREEYELFYTPAVAAELKESFASGREFWRLARAGLLSEAEAAVGRLREFGPGERAAISLAVEHPDWLLLIDDRRPFQAAADLGVSVVCTPVLVVELFLQDRLSADDTLRILARLAAMQTVSPILLAAALAQLGQVLAERKS